MKENNKIKYAELALFVVFEAGTLAIGGLGTLTENSPWYLWAIIFGILWFWLVVVYNNGYNSGYERGCERKVDEDKKENK